MKKLSIIFFAVMFTISLAAEVEKSVESKIESVTVFLQGAQITRTASVNIPSGVSKIVFEGVSPHLKTNSIKAGGRGNFIIMETQFNTKHIPPTNKKENAVPKSIEDEMQRINDSMPELDFLIESLNLKLTAWTKEKQLLERNQLMQGNGKSDSLPLFVDVMEFYRLKIHEINKGLIQVKKELFYANKKKTKLQTRLTELNNYKRRLQSENTIPAKYVYQVVVTVSAKAATYGTINIDYFVNNANWIPSYDLRAENSKSPVNLTYKASITQNTGEDWKNAKITLSTMNPNRPNTKPILRPWKLRYYVKQVIRRQSTNVGITQSNITMNVDEELEDNNSFKEFKKMPESQLSSQYTQQVTNMANVEFQVDLNYSIPSDAKPHLIVVMEEKVPSVFEHFAVPKLSTEAFLVSRMSGWENLNLLPGNANIYFKNTFIGATYLDPNTIEDTMNVALGRDQGIAISRKKRKDEESTKIIGVNKEKEITIEVTIKNKKNETVDIVVEDQVPISDIDEIKVAFDADQVKDAEYNKKTGKLSWDLTLKPYESKKLKFTYTIKYPKDKKIM
jgi:uncharacterized protein (TIGR02231 family)